MFEVGDAVTVSINLRGRAWDNPQGETKYFNTVEAWRIEGESSDKAPGTVRALDGEVGDLPF